LTLNLLLSALWSWSRHCKNSEAIPLQNARLKSRKEKEKMVLWSMYLPEKEQRSLGKSSVERLPSACVLRRISRACEIRSEDILAVPDLLASSSFSPAKQFSLGEQNFPEKEKGERSCEETTPVTSPVLGFSGFLRR
jgi:hypothetical protein